MLELFVLSFPWLPKARLRPYGPVYCIKKCRNVAYFFLLRSCSAYFRETLQKELRSLELLRMADTLLALPPRRPP